MTMNILENRDYKPIKGYKKWMGFFLGLTSTMPIVGIHIGSRDISFYRILFLIMILYTGIQAVQQRIMIGVASKKLLAWLSLGIVSCMCGWIFLSGSAPEWSSAAASNIVRVTSLMVFALFWGSQKDTKFMNEAVCKGFFYGCLINCVWAIIDAAGYYLLGRSINNIVFAGYIARNNIRYNSLSLIYASTGFIRSGGFNSDPAQLGFIAPIVACYAVYKKKYWMLIMAAGAILASASTTALVTSIIICLLNVQRNKEKHGITIKAMVITFVAILAVTGVLVAYWNQISHVINSAYSRFAGRLSDVYLSATNQDIRWDYIRFAPRATLQVLPFMILGSGFGTASLGYVKDSYILSQLGAVHNFAYDMENTYLAYLFDTGIVGIVFFIMILRTLVVNYKNTNDEKDEFSAVVWCMVCSSLVSIAFYHYVLFGPQMLMFTIALSQIDKKREIL